ncbi:unnamed protein product [Aphanomyces euteiches]|uniref:Coiled-coil domain-containing protein 12 n=1 Tax=Aphanomyces euteiches TaxID=100861 RepID=A0A6G0WSN7_9STRA|nr:hypothetical protein Ae201684_011932 [Aphanomyces euteiches]KAH9056043.1 hypothetical protein Ae201684P_021782 [Aphanomyces euteiches]KAH9108997.1 hypothetical protein AeMF1_015876 [Aphanomyces euteiches]KAH9137287.1 hypothetical protein LEN26_005807 [Aphanomyces euteiches]KAH9139057.1 hypothetical protein AeRB84_016653 [Aphanomyces euteiches]
MENADRAKRLKALRDARNKKEGIVDDNVVIATPKPVEVEEPIVENVKAAAPEGEVEEILSIAPKKPTWDLERGLEKQMKRLERRTQNAIVEILREKMEREMQEDGSDDEEGDDEQTHEDE